MSDEKNEFPEFRLELTPTVKKPWLRPAERISLHEMLWLAFSAIFSWRVFPVLFWTWLCFAVSCGMLVAVDSLMTFSVDASYFVHEIELGPLLATFMVPATLVCILLMTIILFRYYGRLMLREPFCFRDLRKGSATRAVHIGMYLLGYYVLLPLFAFLVFAWVLSGLIHVMVVMQDAMLWDISPAVSQYFAYVYFLPFVLVLLAYLPGFGLIIEYGIEVMDAARWSLGLVRRNIPAVVVMALLCGVCWIGGWAFMSCITLLLSGPPDNFWLVSLLNTLIGSLCFVFSGMLYMALCIAAGKEYLGESSPPTP